MDNLSTVDKLTGPNVSFIKRFHCIQILQKLIVEREQWNIITTMVYTKHTIITTVVAKIPRKFQNVKWTAKGGMWFRVTLHDMEVTATNVAVKTLQRK